MKGTLTSNLTVLFTDIEGFTSRTSDLSRDQIDSLLVVHERITASAVKEYGGTIIKNLGDGYMLSFQSPTNAILCAMHIQKDISDYNSKIPKTEHVWIRIAANSGEVAVKDGDVFGEPVNVASRLLAQTEPGDISLTESVYLAMNKTEIPTTPAGTKILRGVPEAIKVYRVPRMGEKAVSRKKDILPDAARKAFPLQSRINLPFIALACLIAIISLVSMTAANWGPIAKLESDILGTETESGPDEQQPNFFQKLFGGLLPKDDTGTNTSITGPYDSIFTSGTSIGSTYDGNSGIITSPTSTPKSKPRNTNNGGGNTNSNSGDTGITPVPTQPPVNPTPVSCPPGKVVVNNECVNRPQASVTPVQTPAPTPVPTGTQNQGNGNSGTNNSTSGNGGNNNSGTDTGNSKKDTKSNNGQNNDNGNNGNGSSGNAGSDTGSSGTDTKSGGNSKK